MASNFLAHLVLCEVYDRIPRTVGDYALIRIGMGRGVPRPSPRHVLAHIAVDCKISRVDRCNTSREDTRGATGWRADRLVPLSSLFLLASGLADTHDTSANLVYHRKISWPRFCASSNVSFFVQGRTSRRTLRKSYTISDLLLTTT